LVLQSDEAHAVAQFELSQMHVNKATKNVFAPSLWFLLQQTAHASASAIAEHVGSGLDPESAGFDPASCPPPVDASYWLTPESGEFGVVSPPLEQAESAAIHPKINPAIPTLAMKKMFGRTVYSLRYALHVLASARKEDARAQCRGRVSWTG
jgi:hypothetical protein